MFTSDRDGNGEIYSDELGRHRARTPSRRQPRERPGSRSGLRMASRLAFTSDRDGNDEIYVMNIDGTGQTRLTNNDASDRIPIWSPDGREHPVRQ